MKVLVATKEMQGSRPNDFCFLPEGALVGFCHTHDGEDIDAICGCQRSLGGLAIDRSTTTFKVVEREIEREDYVSHVIEANQEFIGGPVSEDTFRAEANELLRIARHFPTSAIIERRGAAFSMRGPKGLRRVSDYRLKSPSRNTAPVG